MSPLNSDYQMETPRPEEVLRLQDPTDAASSLTVIQHNGCIRGLHGEVAVVGLMTINVTKLVSGSFLPAITMANLTVEDAKRLIATLQNLVQEEEKAEWVTIEETPL